MTTPAPHLSRKISHTLLQEEKGVYGAIVIHPKKETIRVDKEAVVALSDWFDENAVQIIRHLRVDLSKRFQWTSGFFTEAEYIQF